MKQTTAINVHTPQPLEYTAFDTSEPSFVTLTFGDNASNRICVFFRDEAAARRWLAAGYRALPAPPPPHLSAVPPIGDPR